jgi:hypothetical protein
MNIIKGLTSDLYSISGNSQIWLNIPKDDRHLTSIRNS